MIDRNKSELERIRRYQDLDDDVEATGERRGYIKWFGIWLKESSIFRIGFGLCFLMVAVLVAKTQLVDRVAWLPGGALWFEIAFLGLIMLMSFTAFSMFYCGSMTYRRQIRETNARMARRDNATPEEVEEVVRQTDKRLSRQSLQRTLICVAAIIVLYPTFGTTLIFPWGGILPFFGMLLLTLGFMTATLYFRSEIAEIFSQMLGRSRHPRA